MWILVNASEYIRNTFPEILSVKKDRDHFNRSMFYGYDFDNDAGWKLNMLLQELRIRSHYRDSLSQDFTIEEEKYSLILANPPLQEVLM